MLDISRPSSATRLANSSCVNNTSSISLGFIDEGKVTMDFLSSLLLLWLLVVGDIIAIVVLCSTCALRYYGKGEIVLWGGVEFFFHPSLTHPAMAEYSAEVFVYTGVGEGAVVPRDVVRVRIDPSVLVVPIRAFEFNYKLQEVELHDGLREIDLRAFLYCTALNKVQLSDEVESIGNYAFQCCNFTKFRSPPLITTIPGGMLSGCKNMFSLEVSETIMQVDYNAFGDCHSLRNVALASNTVVDESAFNYCTDLLHIFDTKEAIIDALRNRFAGLPVHSIIYYKSYYPISLEEIRNKIECIQYANIRSGLHQDCLGMTPLHILACSTVHSLELYQLIVDKYPENLIVEDAWGAVPLLYAVWGNAPSEIIQFLVNSYQSLYPDHEFDRNDMVITLGRANASKVVIQNLLDIQQTLYPMYNIDWDQVLGVLVERTEWNEPHANPKTFCLLTRCSIATRVNAIGVKHFRDAMADIWMGHEFNFNRQAWYTETLTKLEYYESEYRKLKEVASLLEFALWKIRMNDSSFIHGNVINRCNKKLKMDTSEFKLQCRVSCGADYVIQNVWPYLLPPDFVRSYVPDEG